MFYSEPIEAKLLCSTANRQAKRAKVNLKLDRSPQVDKSRRLKTSAMRQFAKSAHLEFRSSAIPESVAKSKSNNPTFRVISSAEPSPNGHFQLGVREAIAAIASKSAKIRVVDARTGRWLELDADTSLIPYLQNLSSEPAELQANGSIRLIVGPEARARKTLNSWKEIAAYMGRGIRTVQRYETTLGLPIRRAAGRERCAVLALSDELDAWLQARPMRTQMSPIQNGETELLLTSKSPLSSSA